MHLCSSESKGFSEGIRWICGHDGSVFHCWLSVVGCFERVADFLSGDVDRRGIVALLFLQYGSSEARKVHTQARKFQTRREKYGCWAVFRVSYRKKNLSGNSLQTGHDRAAAARRMPVDPWDVLNPMSHDRSFQQVSHDAGCGGGYAHPTAEPCLVLPHIRVPEESHTLSLSLSLSLSVALYLCVWLWVHILWISHMEQSQPVCDDGAVGSFYKLV